MHTDHKLNSIMPFNKKDFSRFRKEKSASKLQLFPCTKDGLKRVGWERLISSGMLNFPLAVNGNYLLSRPFLTIKQMVD